MGENIQIFISRKIFKIFVTELGDCPLENIIQVLHTSSFPQGGLSDPGLSAFVRHLQGLMESGGNRSSFGW